MELTGCGAAVELTGCGAAVELMGCGAAEVSPSLLSVAAVDQTFEFW